MPRYAAMLRGINVGGHKRIAMADLRRLFEGLGAENVQTYVQSGNVVFDSATANPAELARRIREAIQADLGHDIAVLLRTHAEMAAVASTRPFGSDDDAHLYVTFLADVPEPSRARALDAAAFAPDEFEIRGAEAYLHFPNGYGNSKLTNEWFEKRLGVAATTRNWRTVNALAQLSGSKGGT
jgi:uncharacterized protein (DUF1697 family)